MAKQYATLPVLPMAAASPRHMARVEMTPAVKDRLAEIRAVILSAVTNEDIIEVMQTLVSMSKQGDTKAASLLLDYCVDKKGGKTTNIQNNILANDEDVEAFLNNLTSRMQSGVCSDGESEG